MPVESKEAHAVGVGLFWLFAVLALIGVARFLFWITA